MKIIHLILATSVLMACSTPIKYKLDQKLLTNLGLKYKTEFSDMAASFEAIIDEDATNTEAYLGLADAHILLYVFGYVPRNISMESIRMAYENAHRLDSTSSDVVKLSGIISFLDWDWRNSKLAFQKAIQTDPTNLNARHWYSLWFAAMGRFEEAMAQSDTIATMDAKGDYLVGRSSLLYFQYRFEEMKPLMLENIKKQPDVPWAYDWLAMAYNGLGAHEDALTTYFKAFELSDGTVEVGGGLGHALGHAGETELAKQMADYYTRAAKDNYLPPVQRSFIHLGMGDYDMALDLLEQAYNEQSWFLIFMQTEHWYDPIRKEKRFLELMKKMNFPN